MKMQTETAEERIALLLGMLGPEVADPVLERLPDDKGARLRELLADVQSLPFDKSELTESVAEFMRFFNFAVEHLDEPEDETIEEPEEIEVDDPKKPFVSTGVPLEDLKRLKPAQIVGALQNESPRTIALVLDNLNAAKVGEALSMLPDAVRSDVFVQLRDPPKAPAPLFDRIVKTVVEKGCQLDVDRVVNQEDEVIEKLAELLRHVGQQQRNDMLQALTEQDEELANGIKKMLYLFEDISTLSDRTMQKLLGQVESDILCKSLKDASEEIVDNIMNNLSKRARATLTEELEYLANVKEDEIEEARRGVCDVMASLDAAGDLETK